MHALDYQPAVIMLFSLSNIKEKSSQVNALSAFLNPLESLSLFLEENRLQFNAHQHLAAPALHNHLGVNE